MNDLYLTMGASAALLNYLRCLVDREGFFGLFFFAVGL